MKNLAHSFPLFFSQNATFPTKVAMVPLKKKEEYKNLKTLKEEIKLHFFSDAPKEWHLQPRLHVAQDW